MLEPHEYLSQADLDRIAAEARDVRPAPLWVWLAYGCVIAGCLLLWGLL